MSNIKVQMSNKALGSNAGLDLLIWHLDFGIWAYPTGGRG